ncbi:MAG: NAD-dependent epimerase/dehydratase family protein, partial [Verrucomicrobiota bacterium]
MTAGLPEESFLLVESVSGEDMGSHRVGNRDPGPIVIAGASGFVGTWLLQELGSHYRWIGLSRFDRPSSDDRLEWRTVDLFSLPTLETALQGAKTAVYLVHSMLPSARLVQGDFVDMDLLLADNFARAAEKAGIEHIVYLGGLLPRKERELSQHLASRQEVERTLRSRGATVTVLRAGLIYGRGGSSMRMLLQLVRRLPVMILPGWTRQLTQSIDVRDVVRAFDRTLSDSRFQGGTWDIAGHEPMTYREMILRAAHLIGRKPLTVNFPANFIGLSKLWVALISQSSPQLVNPLLASLRHSLVARENDLGKELQEKATPFEQSVRDSVDEQGRLVGCPEPTHLRKRRRTVREARKVRSVQRMPCPAGWTAPDVAAAYGQWLTRSSGALVRVEEQADDGTLIFRWRWTGWSLLELQPSIHTREQDFRRVYYIRGGLLTRMKVDPPGRFEFRLAEEGQAVLAAIHEYAPRLPWRLYQATQANIHLLV